MTDEFMLYAYVITPVKNKRAEYKFNKLTSYKTKILENNNIPIGTL